ncbi:hypothetical protein AAIR98_000872 [Elusimicrobium simillimum]|uniref:hypothetical protein n=1 Tax=Elusimicrobium simillimum TaxID=3143438 RepID=UPI003C6F7DDA
MLKESVLQAHVLQELTLLENCGLLLVERTNNFKGTIMRRTKKGTSTGFLKTGKKGSTDIKVYLPKGITLHLEAKKEDGKQNPAQIEWQHKLEKLDHIYRIVRSVEELKVILAELCPDVFKSVYQMN